MFMNQNFMSFSKVMKIMHDMVNFLLFASKDTLIQENIEMQINLESFLFVPEKKKCFVMFSTNGN